MSDAYPSHGVKYQPGRIMGTLIAESPSSIAAVVKFKCSIGYLSYTGRDSELFNTSIGRFCSIAPGFASGPTNHPTDRLSSHLFTFNDNGPFAGSDEFADWLREPPLESNEGKVIIGHDVWIGRNVTIKRGVRVGTGAVIGAGSIITKDVAPYTIVAGAPARVIKKRFPDDVIKALLELKWYNYDLRKSAVPNLNTSNINESISLIRELIDTNTLRLIECKRYRITSTEMREIKSKPYIKNHPMLS